MTIPPNTFKRALAQRSTQLGFWLSSNSLSVTEIASGAGFDWLLLDMEHTAITTESVERHLLAARHGGNTELVVRIPSVDPVIVKRLMDTGIRSFMFPWVESVEQARLAVSATRYPPHGIRGYAGVHRANLYSRDRGYPAHFHEEVCVILQVESPQAVALIPEYGAIEGVDGILVGPNDLAANMGLLGQSDHQRVRDKITEALAMILATKTAPGILNFDPQRAGALLTQGFSFAAVGADLVTLVRGADTLLGAVKAATSA